MPAETPPAVLYRRLLRWWGGLIDPDKYLPVSLGLQKPRSGFEVEFKAPATSMSRGELSSPWCAKTLLYKERNRVPVFLGGHPVCRWHLPSSRMVLLTSLGQGKICFASCLEPASTKQPRERPLSSEVAEHASHIISFYSWPLNGVDRDWTEWHICGGLIFKENSLFGLYK